MKRLLLLLLLSGKVMATSFTEFYVNPNAAAGCTNVNAGSTSTGTATYTSTATVAGGWNGAAIFTPDDGSTPASTVSVGMFASIFTNGVNTNAIYVGLITNVAAGVNGAISISGVAKAGTLPLLCLGANAAITIKVGGTWTGPNTTGALTVAFPWNFAGPNLTNTSGNMTCVNFVGGTNYNCSNAITHSVSGPIRWEGYTNAPHDGGRADFVGLASGINSYVAFTFSCARNDIVSLGFKNNGSASTAQVGVNFTGGGNLIQRCVFENMRSAGLIISALNLVVECEASTNNLGNVASIGAIHNSSASVIFLRCIAHDNTTANTSGFISSQSVNWINCISYRNGLNGFFASTTGDPVVLLNCDSYWNNGSGFDISGVPSASQLVYIENSNFLTNGAFGMNSSGAATQFKRNGGLFNIGLGSGNRTNASGGIATALSNIYTNNFITYASGVTPWVAPDTGDFRINLATAYGTGRGAFLQTATGLTNNLASFPSIGALQPAGFTNATSSVFSQ